MSFTAVVNSSIGNFTASVNGSGTFNVSAQSTAAFNVGIATVGPQGPAGTSGVLTVDAPLIYDSVLKNLSIDLSDYATEAWVLGKNYLISSDLAPYLLSSTAASTYYPLTNPSNFITAAALTGYATEAFVTSQGYITSAALTPYLTSADAATTYYLQTNPAGFITSAALSGYATESWVTSQGYLTAPYNPFNQSLNTTDIVNFQSVEVGTIGGDKVAIGTQVTVVDLSGGGGSPVRAELTKNGLFLSNAGAGITFPDGTIQTTAAEGGDFLPLAGGTMTGAILFGTAGQNIDVGSFDNGTGGSNGISLNCAVNYELNWQGGFLENRYSGTAYPIGLNSNLIFGTIGSGIYTEISSNGSVWATVDNSAYGEYTKQRFHIGTSGALNPVWIDASLNMSTGGNPSIQIQPDGASGDAMKIDGFGLTFPDATQQTTAYTGPTNPFDQSLNTTDSVRFTGAYATDSGASFPISSIMGAWLFSSSKGWYFDYTGVLNVEDNSGTPSSVKISGTAITFPDATVQTTAWTGSYNPFDQSLNIGDAPSFGSITLTDTSTNITLNGGIQFSDTSIQTTAFPPAGGTTLQYIDGTGGLQTFPTGGAATRLDTTVFNNSGVTIPAFSLVYINGRHGNDPTIALAQANAEGTSRSTFGFTTTAIADQDLGTVIQVGLLEGVNTFAYAEGALLFLSPTVAGGFTDVQPYSPNHYVNVGTVIRAHPTQGSIQVRIINSNELNELSDVQVNSAVSGDILVKNGSGYWVSQSKLTAGVAVLGSSNTFAANQIISVTDNTNAALRVTQLGTGDAFVVEDSTNPDASPFIINADGNIGIGRQPTSRKLEMTGNFAVTGQSTLSSTAGAVSALLIDSPATATADCVRITNLGTGNSFVVEDSTNPDSNPFVITAAGDVAIGNTTTSGYKLLVSGQAAVSASSSGVILTATQSNVGGIAVFTNTATATSEAVRITNLGTGNSFVVEDETNPDSSRFVINSGGSVGIGVSSPSAHLDIQSGISTRKSLICSHPSSVYLANNVEFNESGSGVNLSVTSSATATGDAVRITNLGTGNSLFIEDSTSPDSSPVVVDAFGGLIIGKTAATAGVRFDVVGNAEVLGRSYFRDSSASGGNPVVWVRQLGASTAVALQVTNQGTGASFRVDDEATDTTPFIVDAGGLVGVSNPSPAYTLDVTGTVNATSYRFPDATTQNHAYPFSGVTATSIEGGLLNASAPSSTNPFATEGFTNSAVSAYAASVTPLLPTTDQKAALTAAETPSSSNAIITESAMTTYVTGYVASAVPSATTSTEGRIEIATDAEVLAGTDTTKAVVSKDVLWQGLSVGFRRNLTTWASSVSGTGATLSNSAEWGRQCQCPNAGIAGYAVAIASGGTQSIISRGRNIAQIDWTKQIVITGSFALPVTCDVLNVFRFTIGKPPTGWVIGNLVSRGFGWSFACGGILYLDVHDGTTLRSVSTGITIATTAAGSRDFILYSDGSGNVELYIDDVLVASSANGPTGTGNFYNNGIICEGQSLTTGTTVNGRCSFGPVSTFFGR